MSFYGEHTLNFPNVGLHVVKGQKAQNSLNSNGSGKSSFLESIAYALDYGSLPATDLQNWNTDSNMEVVLNLLLDSEPCSIRRSSGHYEVVYKGNKFKAGSAKEWIQENLLSSELISFITYRPQGIGGNFLPLSGTDKLEFLVKLLELDKYDVVASKSLEKQEVLSAAIIGMNTELSVLNNNLINCESLMQIIDANVDNKNTSLVTLDKEFNYGIEPVRDEFFNKDKVLELQVKISNLECKDLDPESFSSKDQIKKLNDELTLLESNPPQNVILDNEAKVNAINEEIKQENCKLKSALEVKRLADVDYQQAFEKHQEKQKIKETTKIRVSEIRALEMKAAVERENLKNLIKQVKDVESGVCFNCKREWHQDHDLLTDLYNKVHTTDAFLIDVEEKSKLKKELEDSLNSLVDGFIIDPAGEAVTSAAWSLDTVQKKIIQLNQQLKSEVSSADTINKLSIEKHQNKIQNLKKQLDLQNASDIKDYERAFEVWNMKVTQAKRELDVYINNCRLEYESAFKNFHVQKRMTLERIEAIKLELLTLKQQQQKTQKNKTDILGQVGVLNATLKQKQQLLDLEKEIFNVLGKENFLRLVLEEVLYCISQKANAFLHAIPNTIEFTVLIDTEKESKSGKVKKGINLKVYRNGVERPYKSFSGGERCAINLSIDAAISDIISERSGKKFGWLFLDEATDGMDTVSKLESIEILKQLSHDKLILLVEHTMEINETLDGQIIIEKDSVGSKFAQ